MPDRPTAPPPITAQRVEMPRGGGGIQDMGEHFQAGAFSGEFSFGIPLVCSPCRDFAPELELGYSSMGGNGLFGQGFRVTVSSIARQTTLCIPRYDDSDIFLLDGEQLTPVAGGVSTRTVNGVTYTVTLYRHRHETLFQRTERWRRTGGEDFWRVLDRSGVIWVYGRTAAARVADVADPLRIGEWLVEYAIHPRGDVRAYSYKREDDTNVPPVPSETGRTRGANLYLERIRYGNDVAYFAPDGGIAPLPDQEWHFETVFDFGEYDTAPDNDDPYTPVRPWPARADPFSNYRFGFERRTHRLCRNVLMFHRFADELGPEPVLVHALEIAYDEDPTGTTVSSVRMVGYRHYPGQPSGLRYVTRTAPALTMTYSAFDPESNLAATPLVDVDGRPIEGFTSDSGWTVTDLYGDGVPGLLYADGESVSYRRPVATGPAEAPAMSWSARHQAASFPLERSAATQGVVLSDLDGDGRLDLLRVGDGVSGFYRSQGECGWDAFTPFRRGLPEFWEPGYTRADLGGDGRADVVWKDADTIGWFPSEGEGGFDAARLTAVDPTMPPTLDSPGDARQLITFADPIGGGVPSLVRISDGAVECWPSLGYGRFAAPVRMSGVPVVGADFDAGRVRLADVDGSGVPALIHIHADHLDVFRNLGGNGFAAQALTVPLPAPYGQPDQLRFEDLTGSGHECIVFCTDDPSPQAWSIDLCGAVKPYLIVEVDNNHRTRRLVSYRSCAYDRLLDAQAGTPWITSVPFALQVVARVLTTDAVSHVTTPVSYRYHHGHYDHVEREFRGFGMVEQTDAVSDALLTKTWFHTGAWQQEQPLEAAYRREYFQGDPHPWPACPVVYDVGAAPADPETARQAEVAMSGQMLRQERYGLDGSPAERAPFDVVEQGYRVEMLQPARDGVYGAFAVHERTGIEAQYERVASDPLVQQHFVLEVDGYGEVLLECAVACPRRAGAPDPAIGQDVPRAMATRRGWYAITDQPDAWLLGEPAEQTSWEISGLAAPDQGGLYYSFDSIVSQVQTALAGPGPAGAAGSGTTAVLVEAFRYVYAGEPITPQALLVAREEAFMEQAAIAAAFAGQPVAPTLSTLLAEEGGYMLGNDGVWWNPSTRESYNGPGGFYQPASTTDAMAFGTGKPSGTTVTYTYDPHWLLLVNATMSTSVADVLAHRMTATRLDYVSLAACQIVDENGSTHEGLRDPLGVVVARSSYGSEWRNYASQKTGFAPLDFDDPPTSATSLDQLLADPPSYLRGASEILFYDLDAPSIGRGAVVFASLVATTYPAPGTDIAGGPIEISVTYHDGARRELQQTQLAEPDPGVRGLAPPRWRTSTRARYNDKGLPCRTWEPSFAASPDYVPVDALPESGISSTATYDALDRVIRIDYAEGTFVNALFGTRSYGPWEVTSADRNDTVNDSAYYQYYVTEGHAGLDQWDLDALNKAAQHYRTPTVAAKDNLGDRSELRRQPAPGAPPLTEYSVYDIVGRELWAADPRLYAAGLHNVERLYTFAGDALRIDSVDAGTQWLLRNAVGRVIYRYDSRGFAVTISYDGLHRVTAVVVSGGDGDQVRFASELHIYGDSLDGNGQPPVPDPASRNLMDREWRRYDDSGLLEQASFALTTQPLTATTWSRSNYADDGDWQLSGASDWASRIADLTQSLDPEAQTNAFTYDALGRVLSATDPAGTTKAVTFHVSGLPDTLTWAPAGGDPRPYVISTQYDAREQVKLITFGASDGTPLIATSYDYDERNARLRTALTTRLADAATVCSLAYHFDPVGNLTHVEQITPDGPATPPADRDHTFDALYRLEQTMGRALAGYTAATERDGSYGGFFPGGAAEPYAGQFAYDDGENLTSVQYRAAGGNWSRTLAVSPTSNRAVPVDGMLVGASGPDPTADSFDADGNALAVDGLELGWSFANRLRRVATSDQTQYMLYDVNGNRTAKVVESGDTVERTLYLGAIERHRRTVNGSVEEAYDCVRLAVDSDSALGFVLKWSTGTAPAGAATSWFQLTDLLGSTVLEIDDTGSLCHGEEYLPYGGTALAYGPARSAGAMALKPRRYANHERDLATGLYSYGLRSYACWLGRWTSPDPALDADGLNLYAFAHNNPVTLIDELGLAIHKHNAAKKAAKAKAKFKPKHRHEDIRSSRFRFFRRLQYGVGGTRNIAMLKLRRIKGNGPKIVYLIARSMGLGVSKMTLRDEEVTLKGGGLKRRSHSEAVLRAVLEIGVLKSGGRTINLSNYSSVYAASTNEGCGAEHENCRDESVPFLAPVFIYANVYKGGAQAAGFEKQNNNHQRLVRKGGGYQSDDESEDEGEAFVADEDQFPGYDQGTRLDAKTKKRKALTEVTATRFDDFMDDAKRKRKKVYEKPERQINS